MPRIKAPAWRRGRGGLVAGRALDDESPRDAEPSALKRRLAPPPAPVGRRKDTACVGQVEDGWKGAWRVRLG